jgi:hypothetical protein
MVVESVLAAILHRADRPMTDSATVRQFLLRDLDKVHGEWSLVSPSPTGCSHVRSQWLFAGFLRVSSVWLRPGADFVHAHGRRRGLRRRLSKLSCAGWLPHDRGFVKAPAKAGAVQPVKGRAG